MKKAITYDDIPGGFEAVDGLKAPAVTTQAVTSPTMTTSVTTIANGETEKTQTFANETTATAGE